VARSRGWYATKGVYMRRKEDGAALKRARKAAGLSQGELAYLCQRSHTTIYLLEKPGPRGMQTCSEDLAVEIARRLHRSVEDLFDARQHKNMAAASSVNDVAGVA
jgi:DNA-binding XRE family transcriptional regulator